MAREKEIKIKLTSLGIDAFLRRITQAGFTLAHTEQQTDIYFDTADWQLYEHISSLRIRQTNGQDESFNFKKVFRVPGQRNPIYVEELEATLPLTDKTMFDAILAAVGLTFDGDGLPSTQELSNFLREHGYLDEQHMSKTRRVFKKDDNEVVVDDVDQVGTVIELECLHDEPLDVVQTILKPHEWERGHEGTSYMWLTKLKGLTSHIANNQRFDDDPDWNVLPHERAFYDRLINPK